jgi:hypothetical protein
MPGLLNAIGAGLGQGAEQAGQWNQQQAQIALARQALLQRQQLMQEYQKQQDAMGAVGAALGGPSGLFPQMQFPQTHPGSGAPQTPQTPIGTGMSAPQPPQPQGITMPQFAPAPPVAPPGGASAAIPPKGGGIPPSGVQGALQTQADLVASSQSPPPPVSAALSDTSQGAPQGGGSPQSEQFMAQIAQTFQQSDPQTFYKAIKAQRPDIDDETAAMATEKLMQMGSRGTPQERMMAMLLGRELSGLQAGERQKAGFGEREKLQAQREASINARAQARAQLQRDMAGGRLSQAQTSTAVRILNEQLQEVRASLYGPNALAPNDPDYQKAKQEERQIVGQLKQMGAGLGTPAPAPAAPTAPSGVGAGIAP